VEVRSAAPRDLNLGLKKKIELAGKNAIRAARPFGRGLDLASRLGAPRDDETGVAQFPFPQKNCPGRFHFAAAEQP
jgi:hypothetical protein